MHINIAKVDFKSNSIGINIAKVDFGLYDVAEPRLDGMYITPADSSAISVSPSSSYYSLHGKYLKYSFDGKKWKNWSGGVSVQPGQKMYIKGEDGYVWTSSTSGKLITSSRYYNVGGDINSLTNYTISYYSNNFKTLFMNDKYVRDASNLILPATSLSSYYYSNMFNGCSALIAAPALPATRLATDCYRGMFGSCSALKIAPVLPATELTENCYRDMFSGCSSLTTAPVLPATKLIRACYYQMFSGYTSLTTAPELPATGVALDCYNSMFYGCTSLTTAPELPAMMMSYGCYRGMFYGCSSLTTAPALPATKLAELCYNSMFNRCSKLNNITMLATDISATDCLTNWVNGVASTGTFTKSPEMTLLPEGANGIPSGWTVVNK